MSLLNFNKDQTFCITLGSKKAFPSAGSTPKMFASIQFGRTTSTKSIPCWCSWCCHFWSPKSSCLHILCCRCHCIVSGDWARAHSGSSDAKMRKINFNAQKMEFLMQKVTKIAISIGLYYREGKCLLVSI